MVSVFLSLLAMATAVFVADSWQQVRPAAVDVVRVPGGGVQPEIVVDAGGVLHLVYLAGEPAASNVYYVRSTDYGRTFSAPLRVNSQDGSAIATGTIRGAQLAVGRDGRVHVTWNGSERALPKSLRNPATKRPGMPMLYSRLDAVGSGFEPQRNLMVHTTNLDGGGSIAADRDGRVFVAWHGNRADGQGDEGSRQVWLARSTDDGRTFERERAISDPATGVCGCCALRLVSDGSELHLLYRTATAGVHRDVYALVSRDHGQQFTGERLHGWNIAACPMTSMAIAAGTPPLAAWETDGQVYMKRLDQPGTRLDSPGSLPDASARRKHPRLAVSPAGDTLLVWIEGTSWGRGGDVAWKRYVDGEVASGPMGRAPGLPPWSFAGVVARPEGGFTVIY